jgi:hypothetical protein
MGADGLLFHSLPAPTDVSNVVFIALIVIVIFFLRAIFSVGVGFELDVSDISSLF